MKIKYLLFLSLFLIGATISLAQSPDSLKIKAEFSGQASAWAIYTPDNSKSIVLGAREIAQFNLRKPLPKKQLLDVELSANIFANLAIDPSDSADFDSNIRPYRAWARYSTPQLEIRLGLQKISFGTASILRPLMWFDQIDPRDPLQLTEGVYGLLGRYYFKNNSNIWLWSLYPNEGRRGFDTFAVAENTPEFGGRYQFPIKDGELGGTYHFRKSDAFDSIGALFSSTPEHRFGVDAKWDKIIGFWVETSWVHVAKPIGDFRNQVLFNVGADYTFGIGNGLNVTLENLLFTVDEKVFGLKSPTNFTALSMNYPIAMFDNLSAIVYYDWASKSLYNYLQWQHSFTNIDLNVIAFWNPENSRLPQQTNTDTNSFGGKGIQLLVVYNH